MRPAHLLPVLMLLSAVSALAEDCPNGPPCPPPPAKIVTTKSAGTLAAANSGTFDKGTDFTVDVPVAKGENIEGPGGKRTGVSAAVVAGTLVGPLPGAGLPAADSPKVMSKDASNVSSVKGGDELPFVKDPPPCGAECQAQLAQIAQHNPDGKDNPVTTDFVASNAAQDPTPGMGPVWSQVAGYVQSGDNAGALAAARAALAQHPDDFRLQAFVQLSKTQDAARTASTEKTVKDRAKELLASLRGDAGAQPPPPGAAILASPLAFSAPIAPEVGRPLTATALSAAGIGSREAAMRFSGPVRDAASKVAIRDFPGAEALLTRRIDEVPGDEPALRLRAFARRQMKHYVPSAADAKGALTLAPWDTRARRVLIDDEVDLGHSAEALSEADAALKEMPQDPQLYAARANVYASLGERDKQLADLKQAAALDAQFDQLYEQAVMSGSGATSRRPRSGVVWLGAVGTALLFFSFALFRKRGDTSMRLAMRAEDHALLERGARPDAAPAGFRIVKTLGQGGMGVVYEAVDLGLQRSVALKKLRSEIADSPRERTRFLKEARTVAALKHPNIVEIHSIHEDAEGLFLVFEKVDGQSLHEKLDHGALRPAEAVSYLRQVAMALDYAHSAGVVHQDLKPANIMVAGERAKVMDFGIARRVQETMSTLSRVEVAGTPAYMAPEQELGGVVTPAADLYALGACAYELLTGRVPFPGGARMMKAEKKFRPASEVAPTLPQAADAVIGRALEPEPGARWPSAASFVDALAKSLS